jgi:membrane associated rhomboid family serine protease
VYRVFQRSGVEQSSAIAINDDVALAFSAHFAGFFGGLFAARRPEDHRRQSFRSPDKAFSITIGSPAACGAFVAPKQSTRSGLLSGANGEIGFEGAASS